MSLSGLWTYDSSNAVFSNRMCIDWTENYGASRIQGHDKLLHYYYFCLLASKNSKCMCLRSTVGRVCNAITNTAGVQSLLFELWPCVWASIGRVAVMASVVYWRLLTVLQHAEWRECVMQLSEVYRGHIDLSSYRFCKLFMDGSPYKIHYFILWSHYGGK